jgi:hypothetical protein
MRQRVHRAGNLLGQRWCRGWHNQNPSLRGRHSSWEVNMHQVPVGHLDGAEALVLQLRA